MHVAVACPRCADDALRIVMDAAVGDGGVGVGHLERRDRVRCPGSARATAVQVGGDAHGVGHLDHLVGAERTSMRRTKAGVRRHAESALDGERVP